MDKVIVFTLFATISSFIIAPSSIAASTSNIESKGLNKLYIRHDAIEKPRSKNNVNKKNLHIKDNKTTVVLIEVGEVFPAPANNPKLTKNPYQKTKQNSQITSKPKAIDRTRLNTKTNRKFSKRGRMYLGTTAGLSIGKIADAAREQNQYSGYNIYSPSNNYNTNGIAGINGGYEFNISTNTLLALGIGAYKSIPYFKSEGNIWYKNGSFHKTYRSYEYKLHITRFMAETRLGWLIKTKRLKFIPFISAGIGAALHTANSYQETIIDDCASEQPPFASNSKTSFAYQLGSGIFYPFNLDRSRLSIGYQYVDWGDASFDKRKDHDYELIAHQKSHEIYIGYTHLFNF